VSESTKYVSNKDASTYMGSDEKEELSTYLASRDDINTIFGMLE
jgi:hypothetical protein